MMSTFNMMTSYLNPEVAVLSDQWTIMVIETLKLLYAHT